MVPPNFSAVVAPLDRGRTLIPCLLNGMRVACGGGSRRRVDADALAVVPV